MGQEVLLPRRDACREREVNLLWRLFLLRQEKTQSSVCTLRAQALPPLPRVLRWGGCCAGSCLCSQAKAQALNWLPSHGRTAPPAFPGLLLLPSSTSICGHAAVSVCLSTAASGCVMSPVCPCNGHCCSSGTLLSGYQGLALHCQGPSLGLMAAEPARLGVCSHLGSGTATLRGPKHHQALPWQGALWGLAVPPGAGTALTCPRSCFMSGQELRHAQCPTG